MIGFAMCGSFCTHNNALETLRALTQKHEVIPILSNTAATTDTRFGNCSDLIASLEDICGCSVVKTITDAEPLGPKIALDAIVICPCTGNTLAKLACAITDTPVCMAAKAHLRCNRPLVIALATNDALSANFSNIGTMASRKNVFFVPFSQDSPLTKPHSLVADFSLVPQALEHALKGEQLQPILA